MKHNVFMIKFFSTTGVDFKEVIKALYKQGFTISVVPKYPDKEGGEYIIRVDNENEQS